MQNKADRFWVFKTSDFGAIRHINRDAVIAISEPADHSWYILDCGGEDAFRIPVDQGNPSFDETLEWLNYEKSSDETLKDIIFDAKDDIVRVMCELND